MVNVPHVSPAESHASGDKAFYTLGHSDLESDHFVELLSNSRVKLVADVRSAPHSGRFPQFSQPVLQKMLEEGGISYLFLGEELGGRPDDLDAYRRDGVVDYRARRKSYAFGAGLERLIAEQKQRSVVLLCAEEDPLECHRFLMICPELVRAGVQPLHIRGDGRIETQEAAENRLLETHGFAGIANDTLFPQEREDALEQAYELQAQKVAFRISPLAVDRW
jgi:uncharacterized protein (DUF488 family)